MFGMFKKKKVDSCEIYSPVNGICIPIENCGDQMFSQKLLGDGLAFELSEGIIYSPCNGIISAVANTKHAFGITSENGTEILIHVGFETNSLNGEGFKIFVSQGNSVKKGQKVMEVNLDLLKSKELAYITPLVITNGQSYDLIFNEVYGEVSTNMVLLKTQKK